MLSKRHVLVVDEHPQSVSHMQAMLKGTGLLRCRLPAPQPRRYLCWRVAISSW